jgi:hypothetical protein
MLITIKTLSGRKLAFEMEGTQTISDIKLKLFEKEQIPQDQIRLIYGGKVVNDDMTVEQCKIQPGTELMMALHLRG